MSDPDSVLGESYFSRRRVDERAKNREAELARGKWISVAFCVGIVVFSVGSWILSSHFEAQSFNRITGKDATTWDALWVELRVQ